MKRELLLSHECLAIAAKNGLAGLHEYAHHEHLQKVLRSSHNYLDGPAIVAKAFYYNPACGECGVIFATAGGWRRGRRPGGRTLLLPAS